MKQDLKLGMHAGVRYRTVSEASILDMCHLAGWACESGEGSPGRGRTREALEHRIALGLGVRRGAAGERSDSGEVGATGQNPRRGHRAEPPTEGGWFLVGCSARSTPPSADRLKPLGRELFPEPLLGGRPNPE